MAVRHLGLLLALGFWACPSPGALESAEPAASAERFWDLGQEAMRQGQPRKAADYYRQSLATDPTLTRNYLSLAAAYLEMDDEPGALPPLTCYMSAHPEQLVIRAHLADLLLRLKHSAEARTEFERCIASAQDRDDASALSQLVHCHTRLMEMAEADEDAYGEHLHRGIGLFLLARQRAALPEPEEILSPEALLCKAAGELALAHLEKTEEARPAWYLHEVWSHLAQKQPARRYLRAALRAAPFTYLTAAEQRGLQLACRCQEIEQTKK